MSSGQAELCEAGMDFRAPVDTGQLHARSNPRFTDVEAQTERVVHGGAARDQENRASDEGFQQDASNACASTIPEPDDILTQFSERMEILERRIDKSYGNIHDPRNHEK
jgi:hypothetical protein